MKSITFTLSLALCVAAHARGPRPTNLGASEQPIGDAGVAWYTTWDTAKEEAKRSNRPIFFFAAAAQCGSVSGTF